MRMDSAHYLVNKLMGRDPENDAPFDEMDLSAMKEIGNIITASYLSALSSMTNLTILPSVPYIAVDMAGAILSVPAIQFGQYGNNALLIETEFGDERMINGYFILMPEEESYAKILSSWNSVIEEIVEYGRSDQGWNGRPENCKSSEYTHDTGVGFLYRINTL